MGIVWHCGGGQAAGAAPRRSRADTVAITNWSNALDTASAATWNSCSAKTVWTVSSTDTVWCRGWCGSSRSESSASSESHTVSGDGDPEGGIGTRIPGASPWSSA